MSMNNKATVDAIDSCSSRRTTMSDLLKPPTSGFKSFVSSRRASNLFKKEKKNIDYNNDNNINHVNVGYNSSSSSVLSESPLLKHQMKKLIDNNNNNNINHHNILNTQLSLQLSNDKNKHMIQSLLKINNNNSPQHKQIIDLISPSKATLPLSSSSLLSSNKMLTTTDTENYPEFHIIKNRIIDTIMNHSNDIDDDEITMPSSSSTPTTMKFSPSKDNTMRLVSSITSAALSSSSSSLLLLSPERIVTTQQKGTTTTPTIITTTTDSVTSPHSIIPIITITDPTNTTISNKNIKHNINDSNKNDNSSKDEIKKLQQQILDLNLKLHEKEQINKKIEKRWQEVENRRLMACEEVNGVNFMNSILEQRIEELEQHLSRERMNCNEALSQKSRKHKHAIKKISQERADYESRADMMIQQMNEQMLQLQTMAMSRIETLENELIEQRHMNDKLQNDCNKLNITTNNAVELVSKYKELIKTMKKQQQKHDTTNTNNNNINAKTNTSGDKNEGNDNDDDDDRLFYDTKCNNIDLCDVHNDDDDDDGYAYRYDVSRGSVGENRSSNGSHTSYTIPATSRDSNSSTQTIPKEFYEDGDIDDDNNNDDDNNEDINEVGKERSYDIMMISDNDIDEDEDGDEDNDGIWKTTM